MRFGEPTDAFVRQRKARKLMINQARCTGHPCILRIHRDVVLLEAA